MKPNLKEEKLLWKKGYKFVAGIDEVGRGCLAGPVVAGVVIIDRKIKNIKQFQEIKDSKKLSPQKREEIYKLFKNHKSVKWATGRVSEKIIDKINISEATKLAMKNAVHNLEKKPDFLLLDGTIKLDLPISQKSIIKGDQKIISCSLASIMAKVTRDKIMEKYHKKYPLYGFNKNKGYPTQYHFKMIKKHSFCKIHRKTFGTIKII